ncbi:MAG: hypothetical protein AAB727_00195 [Patescibacteria group bacterium]
MERIQYFIGQSKSLLHDLKEREGVVIVLVVVLVGLGGFGLGRLSKLKEAKVPVRIEYPRNGMLESAVNGDGAAVSLSDNRAILESEGTVVGSKNGTKYHYPWCSGAQRIKEENKIWFSSEEEARKAGYAPAGNCKGLQ